MNTISFPNMFDVNNAKLSMNLSYNYRSTHESLTSLLLTSPGELLGDPVYGCGIKSKLFDVKTDANINELKSMIINSVNRYIPHIRIDYVKIFHNVNDNKYKINICYRLNNNIENQIYELIL